jgi:GAF domain-containing protein
MLVMRALAWATEQARATAEQCGERAVLCVPVRDDDHHCIALLARASAHRRRTHDPDAAAVASANC